MGRKAWVYTDSGLSQRVNKMQLAIRLLDENGGPMRLKKLKEAMEEIRSVGIFQPYKIEQTQI